MPPLPNWLQPADPARYEAEGLRIGDTEASEANSAAAQAAAGQRAGQELQLRQQQLEREATAAAQKFQAQQGYQQALAAGGDPIQAILKFGPLMGQGTDTATAIRASMPTKKAPLVPTPIRTLPVLDQSGNPIPNMISLPNAAGTGMEARNLPGSDVPGYVSPQDRMEATHQAALDRATATKQAQQTRLQISILTKKKTALKKLSDDDHASGKVLMARFGRPPTRAERESYEKELDGQMDEIDRQLEAVAGGGTATKDSEGATDQQPAAENDPLGLFK